MAAEGNRPIGRPGQGDPGLDRDRVRLGALGRRLVGGEVVRGEGAGQLVVAERLEVAGGRKVPGPPLALGQRAVGDLADQRLDEAVLAALGRARVGLDLEELAPDEGPEPRLELGRSCPLIAAEAGQA